MPGRFDGKVVLVTGGASGIGEATVMAFAHEGADVVIADVNDAGGRDLVERLTATGHHATFVHTDVTDEGSVREMVNHAVSTFGGLHCAANVAGGMAGGDRAGLGVHETEAAQWDGTMDVNLRSTWLCLKYEIAHMIEHGGGNIVNVASVAGMLGAGTASVAYAVSKAAVIHLTRMAATEYGGRGVRVNAIAPGLTRTPAVARSLTAEQQIPARHVIKRMVEPSEQADAILWLCSDQAAMITGLNVPVDGGWTAR